MHYSRHHRTYVNNYNELSVKVAEHMARGETEKALALTDKLNFNAGGYLNHEFFFDGLCATKDSARPDEGTTLREMIN